MLSWKYTTTLFAAVVAWQLKLSRMQFCACGQVDHRNKLALLALARVGPDHSALPGPSRPSNLARGELLVFDWKHGYHLLPSL